MPKRVAMRLLAIGLIFVVSALGVHALVHLQDQSDGGQCQVCHLSHGSVPLPAAQVFLAAPVEFSRHSVVTPALFEFATICDEHCPRGPPA
jgi:hypothetical protein